MSKLNRYTQHEINGQPILWKSIYDLMLSKEQVIQGFLSSILNKKNLQIILTGAGSSAFIGDASHGLVQQYSGCLTQSIATTDIVTHPQLCFREGAPILLVSFARSGNSPESLETVKLADSFCDEIYHLIITCNRDGKLAQYAESHGQNALAILLPEEANDKSLAMTGSFTSMLLGVLLIFRKGKIFSANEEIKKIIEEGNLILEKQDLIKEIATKDFERVVFLGSGPMLGIARESHLKLQELTDGQVICKHDSFLGFRHGPRAVTNKKTLMVYLFSADDHVYRYEHDLALSIAEDPREIECLSIGRKHDMQIKFCHNLDLKLRPTEELNIVPATLVGQLLGMYKCLNLGLDPDKPSKSGTISRVVEGVTIYPYPKSLIE